MRLLERTALEHLNRHLSASCWSAQGRISAFRSRQSHKYTHAAGRFAAKRLRVAASSASPALSSSGDGAQKPAPPQPAASSSSTTNGRNRGATDPLKATATSTSTVEDQQQQQPQQPAQGLGLNQYHYATFFSILFCGVLFLAVLLYLQADIHIQQACFKVVRRLFKTVALRQVMGILAAMTFVRFGLEPLVKLMRRLFVAPGSWEKSSEFYILRELYQPLEFLFAVAAFTTLVENFLPQLIALPKALIQNFVRSTLTLTFVIAAARVVFNIKAQMMEERRWQMELRAEVTRMRRVEAVDKLLSVLTLLVASVFGLQAIGLDVNSVLAIGGVGGLAVGLAGREILENLFTGLIILSSSPFEVGDEVQFSPPNGNMVEGIVTDVGWYRTCIRSFEREMYTIPNSVFSRNVVLNITRKNKEWRFFEFFGLQLTDITRAAAVIADMRKIIRQDPRIIQKLHRRVFLDKITREQVTVYVSCYVEAQNRDAFMAVKQDLLLAFVDCVERNRAELARVRVAVEMSNALTMKTRASLPSATADQDMDDDEDDFLSQSVDDEQAAAEMMADIMAGNDPRKDSIDISIEPQKQLPGASDQGKGQEQSNVVPRSGGSPGKKPYIVDESGGATPPEQSSSQPKQPQQSQQQQQKQQQQKQPAALMSVFDQLPSTSA